MLRIGRLTTVARGVGLGMLLVGVVIAAGSLPAARADALVTSRLGDAVTPESLANSLVGHGVTVSNVTFTGDDRAAGNFGGGTDSIGIPSGVVLGTGLVQSEGDAACSGGKGLEGPNQCDENTEGFGTDGDTDLDTFVGEGQTLDAAVLEFDFVPEASTVSFDYVFGSEEYNEYVNDEFNDVFGFFVNGENCATVPTPAGDKAVSVNTVNAGPEGDGTDATNPDLFRNNSRTDPGPATIQTELDGLTVVLECTATVTPNETNHMKLAIADVSDSAYDSAVFIAGSSLVSGTTTTTAAGATTSSTTPTTAVEPTTSTTTPDPTTTSTTTVSTSTTSAPTTSTTAAPSTTTTSTSTTTPTSTTSTSTTAPAPTTSTSTTTAPTSTSTSTTAVGPTSSTAPTTTTIATDPTTSTTLPTSVLGATLTRTGFDRMGVALAAVLLLCGGGLLTVAARARRPEAAHYKS